jgi:hypothetical protein
MIINLHIISISGGELISEINPRGEGFQHVQHLDELCENDASTFKKTTRQKAMG